MHRQLRAVAGRQPARVHEERVVEQRVARADGEEGRRHSAQIGVERRDVGGAPILVVRQKRVVEFRHVPSAKNEPFVAKRPLARRHREVVRAVDQVGRPEPRVRVSVAHAQERHRGQMSAGRLAADGQHVSVELLAAVLDDPERRRLAVVGRRRVRMLGGETIFDADAGQARVVHDLLEQGILLIRPPKYPSAAVDVQIDAPRSLGRDDVQANRPAVPGNFNPAGARGLRLQGERPFAACAGIAHRLRASDPPVRHRGQQLDHFAVEGQRLRRDGIRREHRRIKCVHVVHPPLPLVPLGSARRVLLRRST